VLDAVGLPGVDEGTGKIGGSGRGGPLMPDVEAEAEVEVALGTWLVATGTVATGFATTGV
jgi:hypothetical protein